jgi:hypothetical protein
MPIVRCPRDGLIPLSGRSGQPWLQTCLRLGDFPIQSTCRRDDSGAREAEDGQSGQNEPARQEDPRHDR